MIALVLTLLSGVAYCSESLVQTSSHQQLLSQQQPQSQQSHSFSLPFQESLNFSQPQSESSEYPYSEHVGVNDLVGLLTQSRWGIQWRDAVKNAEDETESLLLWLVCITQHNHLHQLAGANQLSTQSQLYAFVANYRLAGWKDSNALYVALNAHYSTYTSAI